MRLPEHVKPAKGDEAESHRVKALLRKKGLHTVCESARCPNIGECFKRRTATFLILGDVCSRSCAFCAVKKGVPVEVDPGEPKKVAETAKKLGLKYVVVTSVSRDDLPDGGAGHFALTIEAIREIIPGTMVEVLIPDFMGDSESLAVVINAGPEVLNHNIETVPGIYSKMRPQADYNRSLELLRRASGLGVNTKSGIMLGMGEEFHEVMEALRDLRDAGCKMLTLGQYLRPTRRHPPVKRYLEVEEYDLYRSEALKLGFAAVASGPLVRSSYHADEMGHQPGS